MTSCNLFLKLSFLATCFCMGQVQGYGYFWHVTDTHLDRNYSRTGNVYHLCHEDGVPFPDNGLYGNYLCDSPQLLVNLSVHSMSVIHSNPDFIIWTGDNLPHTRDIKLDWNMSYEGIKNTTDLLASYFPNTTIFPCIGNHDSFPPNQLHPSGPVYEGYLKKGGWGELLSKEAAATFSQGGFYSQVVKPGLRIVSLNTILWYSPNTYTAKLSDPADQFQWLDSVLSNSSKSSEKVYIIGHVPPGFYNRVYPGQKDSSTYHPQHLEAYMNILKKHYETVIGQLYGHYHMDMFQVLQYGTGTFKGSSLLASSVTPVYFPDAANVSLPVNPSVRLLKFSDVDYTLLDYDQFYFNLTKANTLNRKHLEDRTLFEFLYRFRDAYNVPDLTTESLIQVYEMLKSSDELFSKFFYYLTAGKRFILCDSGCKVNQLCSMSSSSTTEYELCMKNIDYAKIPKLDKPVSSGQIGSSLYVCLGLIIGLIVFSVIGGFMYKKYRSAKGRDRYEPFMHM